MKSERLLYPDALRILAIFAVVVLHVAAGKRSSVGVETPEWKVLNIYDSLVRWSVPVFVMVSGMFMLDPQKKTTWRTLFGKNALRIATAFFIWSAVYAANDVGMGKLPLAWNRAALSRLAVKFFFGHYHLWFLFVIAGLYVVTPVLRKIVEDPRVTEYFLVLAFVFAGVMSWIQLFPGTETFLGWVNRFNIRLPLGFAGYYVAGYYLKVRDIGVRGRRVLYVLGVLSVVATAYFTDMVSVARLEPYKELYNNLLPNTMLPAVAIFVFFKYEVGRSEFSLRVRQGVTGCAGCVFGVYLVYDLFNPWLTRQGVHALSFHPVLAVPAVALALFAASLAVVAGLARIPGLKTHAM